MPSRPGTRRIVLAALLALAAAAPPALACDTCALPGATLAAPTLSCLTVTNSTDAACPSDFYDLTLQAGKTYVFTLCNTTCPTATANFDTKLRLYGPACNLLVTNSDTCGVLSEILYTVPAGGTGVYRIEVTGDFAGSVGDYTLAYKETCPPTSCAVPDGTLNTPMNACQYRADSMNCGNRYYHVTLTQGQSYTFTLCGATCAAAQADFDSRVILLDPSFTPVMSNGNACGDDGEVVYQTDPMTGGGTYCVQVNSESGAQGNFNLGYRVTCQAPSAMTITPISGGATGTDCSLLQSFNATTAGTGDFNWSWTIVPSPGLSATPASGTGTTSGNSFGFQSTLDGAGSYTVIVNVSNDCGSDMSQIVYNLEDRRAPNIVCSASDIDCGQFAPGASRRADRVRAAAAAAVATPAPAEPTAAGAREREVPAPALLSEADRQVVRETLMSSPDPEKVAREIARKLNLSAKQVQVHDSRETRFVRGDPAEALSCPSPCTSGTLQANNPFYEVFLSCTDGVYTARTGPLHSVTLAAGTEQNVIFGGQSGNPSTSNLTFYEHNTGNEYLDPFGARACLFDPPDTANEPMSQGIEAEWDVNPSANLHLRLREEVVAFGSVENNSGIRLTLGATNLPTSTVNANMGVRWQIDYQNDGDDGPLFAFVECSPFSVGTDRATEHQFLPAEIQDFYRIRNNTGSPVFGNYSSTTAIVGFPDTGTPDRLIYGRWPSMVSSGWNYVATEGATGPDSDSAVLYYYGYAPADGIQLAPGASFTRSVVIFTAGDAQSCGGFVPGAGSDANIEICPNECVRIGAAATDNCDPNPSVTLASTSLGAPACFSNPCDLAFPNPGTYNYNWQAVDAAGNLTDCTSTVVVLSPTHPDCVVNTPPMCSAGGPYASDCRQATIDGASASDPEGDALTYNWTSSRPDVIVSPPNGVLPGGSSGTRVVPTSNAILDAGTPPCNVSATLTLHLDDGHGGQSQCQAQVSFDDQTPPTLSGVPGNLNLACSDPIPPPAPVTASDNCEVSPVAYAEQRIDGNCPQSYQLVRTWSATDSCNHQANGTQTITVVDNLAPTLNGVPGNQTVSCDAVPGPPTVTATDNCDTAVPVGYSQVRIDGNCPDNYQLVRTWTAVDDCGNQVQASQTITVVDNSAPTLQGVPADQTVECPDVPPAPPVTALDNCDPNPAVTFNEVTNPGSCPGNYTVVRTWTTTDRCGNQAMATQTITVRDTTPPVADPGQGADVCLWPPNHWYVCFDQRDFADANVHDACSEPVTWRFSGCQSDQPDEAPDPAWPGWNGDGNTRNDCVVLPEGTGFCVRAERCGTGPTAQSGRHYSITMEAVDACGNSTGDLQVATVHVPHDQSPHQNCLKTTEVGCKPNEPIPCRPRRR